MTDMAQQSVVVPSLGINEGSPDQIPAQQAMYLENLLTGIASRMPRRGGALITNTPTQGTVTAERPHAWVFNDAQLWTWVGRRSGESAGASWQSRYPMHPPGGIGNLTGSWVDHVNSGGSSTNVNYVDQDHVPGPRFARVGSYVYGHTQSGSVFTNVNPGGFGMVSVPTRRLLRWDGSAAQPTVYTANAAPFSCADVKAYLNRLWCLGGSAPGGALVLEPSSLFWSDPGGPTTGVVGEWQDDVSGLVNKIVIGRDDNDWGVGLATLPNALLIFKERSIYVLNGSTPSAFTVRQVAAGIGCVDVNSIVEYGDRVYFLARDGFYQTDGVAVTKISTPIDVSLNSTQSPNVNIGGLQRSRAVAGSTFADGYCKGELLPNEYIMWQVGNPSAAAINSSKTPVYHVPTQSWSFFTMPVDIATSADKNLWPWPIRTFTDVVSSSRYNSAAYPTRTSTVSASIVVLTGMTQPFTGDASNDQSNFDGYSSALNRAFFPTVLRSRQLVLAGPLDVAQLHRLIVNYHCRGSGAGIQTIEVLGPTDNVLATVGPFADVSTSVYENIRNVVDAFAEVNEVSLRITTNAPADPTSANGGRYEFRGVTLEYQRARQRRTAL